MKVICDRGALVEALNLVTAVVPSRTPKPVLTCVKLSAADNALTLEATDAEVAIRYTTQRIEINDPGTVLVPADKLNAIVRDSPDATLTIASEQDATAIRGQDARFTVLAYPVDDFPALPPFQGEPDFTIQAQELVRVIQQTIYATAKENSRYAINGVLLEREKDKINVVATDGHRLAVAKGMCQTTKTDNRSAIVPTRVLNTLMRLLGSGEQLVRVKIADNQIHFATEQAHLVSNLVEGNFPPYKDVIPRDGDKHATLLTEPLASAVRRAALLTTEESKGVKMSFAKGGLTLTSRAPELGDAEIKVDLPAYEGDPIEIGFNPAYVLDLLKVTGTDQVQFDLRASNKSCVVKAGDQFLYVLMPVSLQ